MKPYNPNGATNDLKTYTYYRSFKSYFFSSLQLSIFTQMYLYASEVHFELATYPWGKLPASMGNWTLVSNRIKQMLKSSTP